MTASVGFKSWRPFDSTQTPDALAELAAVTGAALPDPGPTFALAGRLGGEAAAWVWAAANSFEKPLPQSGPLSAGGLANETERLPPAAAFLGAFLAAWHAPAGGRQLPILRAVWPSVLGVSHSGRAEAIHEALMIAPPEEEFSAQLAALAWRVIALAAVFLPLPGGPAFGSVAIMPMAYHGLGISAEAAALSVGRCVRQAAISAAMLPSPGPDTPAALRFPRR